MFRLEIAYSSISTRSGALGLTIHHFLSKRMRPYLWLSLHDITPNVSAERLAVYCHNPSPFYKVRNDELFLDKKFTLFTWFYKYLSQVLINHN